MREEKGGGCVSKDHTFWYLYIVILGLTGDLSLMEEGEGERGVFCTHAEEGVEGGGWTILYACCNWFKNRFPIRQCSETLTKDIISEILSWIHDICWNLSLYLGILLYRDGHRFCERRNIWEQNFFSWTMVWKKRLKIVRTKLKNDIFLQNQHCLQNDQFWLNENFYWTNNFTENERNRSKWMIILRTNEINFLTDWKQKQKNGSYTNDERTQCKK